MSPSQSRGRVSSTSRHRPSRSTSHVTMPENALFGDGAVDSETAELLGDFLTPQHEQDETLIEEELPQEDSIESQRQQLPWWKRPSPLWLLAFSPFSTIAMSATIAPKIEIYTLLACSVHKPDIFRDSRLSTDIFHTSYNREDTLSGTTFPLSFNLAATDAEGHHDNASDVSFMEKPLPSPCASDPVVQAAVSKLTTAISASMGVLGCLTTGWWGSFSDRRGRTRIMGITIIGVLLTDVNFIFVTKNYQRVPGGYWFLIVGPLFEGALGGFSSASAAIHAYMADTTRPSERYPISILLNSYSIDVQISRFFPLLGLIFVGIGLGPTFGGLLIRVSHNVLSVFYFATAVHALYAMLVWTIIPESLTKTQMRNADIKYREDLLLHYSLLHSNDQGEPTLLIRTKSLFSFLKPLAIFIPATFDSNVNAKPLKGRKRDWNLPLVALAYGLALSIMGSGIPQMQYLSANFGLTSESLGYFLSVIGITRAIYLAVLLPIGIKLIQHMQRRRSPEYDPLLSDRNASPSRKPHSPAFDLGLARASLVVEMIGYSLLPFAPTGLIYVAFATLISMGAGLSPALQSVALEMYTQKYGGDGTVESGKLFGAMSVVQALSSQILGPAIYGLVYMKTVATFPKAIFLVALVSLVIAFISLSLVRLPEHHAQSDLEEVSHLDLPDHGARDATLFEVDAEASDLRGRKKDVPEVIVTSPST